MKPHLSKAGGADLSHEEIRRMAKAAKLPKIMFDTEGYRQGLMRLVSVAVEADRARRQGALTAAAIDLAMELIDKWLELGPEGAARVRADLAALSQKGAKDS